MVEAGVIDEQNPSASKIALVYGQMNEPPGARLRVALSGLAITEYFRDERNQDVLLFIDNIFGSLRPAPKCPRCSAAPPAPSDTNRPLPRRWVRSRSASPRPRRAPSRRFRRCTCQPTI